MGHLNARLNKIEERLNPSGKPVVLIGHSKEELEERYQEYLREGGSPHAIIVRYNIERIKKRDEDELPDMWTA
jgi:anthranilate phosphoribosyltransferase